MSEPLPPGPGKKVFVKTWGCQMNVYDSERMTGLLRPLGYAETSTPDDADLIILNTCHIREKASEKLYSELGRLRPQAQARGTTVAVAGCVAQAEGEEIIARAPVVDFVFGPQSYHRLPEVLARAAHARGDRLVTSFDVEEKFDVLGTTRTAEGVSALVTVQEGCDKFCTFCVVPYTRGPEVGRTTDQIAAEVRSLVAAGVREITLLGQNVNAWRGAPPAGSGADAPWGLGALCRHLAMIDGLARIRFTTSHPRDMDDELIEALGAEEKLMPYLHLPVQSGADTVLRAMNRGHTADDYRRLIARIRAARPDIAISSDFIVGFPGEDDAAFDATLGLIEDIGFAAAYSFKFSRRPGTPAASMPQQVSEAAKGERLLRLQALIEAQKQRFNEAMVGRVVPVLFDKQGRSAGQLSGRSPWLQAVFADAPLSVCGQIVPVAVEHTMTNSLAGRLVSAA